LRGVLILIILLITFFPSFSSPQTKGELERIKKELLLRQQRLKQKQKEEQNLEKKLKEVSAQAGRVHGKLQSVKEEYKQIEREIENLSKEIQELQQNIEKIKGKLKIRFVELHKLQKGTLLQLLFESKSYGDLLNRMKILSLIAERDWTLIKQYQSLVMEKRDKLDKLTGIQTALSQKAKELEALHKQYVKKETEVKTILAAVRKEKREELKKIAELEKRKKALEELIISLQKKETPVLLSKLKANFPLPAKGILKKLPHYEGVAILCERGTPVKAVANGKVVFASFFEGYGNLLIIEHGRGYHTVYARLEKLLKKVGEKVRMGEVVGIAGSTGAEGMVYFEVRHNGRCEPIEKWVSVPITQ
jgi:septal ring factor EnvC (AmiA/AmiB activator)